MEAYIKYNRISKIIPESEIKNLLEEIVVSGDDIIYYNEVNQQRFRGEKSYEITIITGKRQNRKI